MKTFKLAIGIVLLTFSTLGFAQSVIVDENFQSFAKQGFDGDSTCEEQSVIHRTTFKVEKTYNNLELTYTITNGGITPTCNAKKFPSEPGITTGYVEISKVNGEFIISQLPFIASIEVGVSALGDNRGYAVYKSINNGAWTLVGEFFGSKTTNTDPQLGYLKLISINESNVSLKFVPVLTTVDPIMKQTFRIHNIKIYGN